MSKKDEYINKMEAQMREWSTEVDKLKAKADGAKADMKIKYLDEIEALNKNRAETEEKLQQLRTAGEDAWDDLKSGLEKSYTNLKEALKSAASRFE